MARLAVAAAIVGCACLTNGDEADGVSLGATWPSWVFPKWPRRGRSESLGDTPSADPGDLLLPSSPAKIAFQQKLPEHCRETPLPFASRKVPYKCCLASDEQAPDHSEAIKLLDSPQLPDAIAASLDAALSRQVPLGSAIVWATSGWWVYELCPGRYFRQYHAEESVIQSEYILGVGSSVLSPKPCGSGASYKSAKETVHKKMISLYKGTAVVADGKWRAVAGDGKPYFATTYTNGDLCDLTGKPREVELQLHCRDGGQDQQSLFTVSEVSQCKYQAVLLVDSLCGLPAYASLLAYVNQDADLSPKQRAQLAKERKDAILASSHVRSVDQAVKQELGAAGCIALDTGGWWNYELCYRHWLRQFHEADGVINGEYFIGRGVEANDEAGPLALREQSYLMGKEAVTVPMRTVAGVKGLKANGTWTAHGESGHYFFRTLLTDGTTCDLTGKARETDLQVHCTTEKLQLTVFETETCKYEAKLYLPALCKLQAYQYLIHGDDDYQESRTARIVCAPDGGEGPADTSAGQQNQVVCSFTP
eukprot:TRINITY_DN28502_c0_g1_i1.p1 TRINITY_DN28502_c0_g1~~TRINITY_DN28502_c0_g1_i1.p1  ORF type:complete len:550 (+),score=162.07 TRINITY_DN28502_c0_g1_i1:47-1651(+)